MTFALGAAVSVVLFALVGIAAGWLETRLRLLSVAHAAVMGSGAYAFALLSLAGWSSIFALILAVCTGAFLGLTLVAISQRVVRDDFALFSFAVQVAWFGLVANARPWTGGALGLPGIAQLPLVGTFGRTGGALFWALALLAVLGVLLAIERRGAFPVAAAVVARSGELATSIGLPAARIRLQIGGLYGAALGAAGAVLASFLTFIGPEVFAVSVSVVVIGIGFLAAWRWWGGGIGALLLLGLPEALRLTGLASTNTAFIRQFLAGLMVAASALLILSDRGR